MVDPTNALIACKHIQEDTSANPAVIRCSAAFVTTFRAIFAAATNMEPSEARYEAEQAAIIAYSAAMPPLAGSANIRNFIACVAHGLALEILSDRTSTRLLYAAQIAGSFMEKSSPQAEVSALRTPKSTAA